MSTREEQPATVPPPEGEDDAYSATTKVGAMPAQIMEKLRAEGLLPDEVEEEEKAKAAERDARIAARATPSLEKKSAPLPPPPETSEPPPQLYSTPPAEAGGEEQAPPISKRAKTPSEPAGESIETPVAFAFPQAAALPKEAEPAGASVASAELVSEERPEKSARTTEQKPAKAPSKAVMTIVAILVVVFLIVALLRLRG
jgi:hypothetical protein